MSIEIKTEDMTAAQIEVAVDVYLENLNCKVNAAVSAELQKCDGWEHDAWNVLIERAGKPLFTTQFKTGLGHRVWHFEKQKDVKYIRAIKNKGTVPAKNCHRNMADTQYLTVPPAASIIHSLFLDAQLGNETFENFCDNLRYDKDSRKALEIYLICQKTASELNKIFSQTELNDLQTLTKNY